MSKSSTDHTLMNHALRICLEKNVHFAAYRLPGKSDCKLIVQKESRIQTLENLGTEMPRKGFLIAPFSRESEKAYLINPEIVIQSPVLPEHVMELSGLPNNTPYKTEEHIASETVRDEYKALVEKAIEEINSGSFDKVVLSRIKSVQGNYYSQLPEMFNILCKTYANAFVYLFNCNGNCWLGASPEPFICSEGHNITTVSLAGTRSNLPENLNIANWNRKELLEQDYVTQHIEKTIRGFDISGYFKNGPYVARAGNLLHLRTDVSFPASSIESRIPALVNALHPTPAVCGMSTGKAMDFINKSEKHQRGFYTGFLGPVGIDDLFQLYVNLRCMQVYHDRLLLYVGGGITNDSVPEDEWEETEIKADTLLTVIHQLG